MFKRSCLLICLLAFVAIGTACTTPTPAPTATPMPTYTPLPTLVPLPTYTPLPTLTPLPTFTPFPSITPVPPTATPVPPTPTPLPTVTPTAKTYAAPVITTPFTNITLYPGEILLTWDYPAPLAEDEWFQIVGWKEQLPDKKYSITWTKDRSWRFVLNSDSYKMFPWIVGLGQYYLNVQVIRGKDGKFMGELSPVSKAFPWRW